MKLLINGTERRFDESLTVAELLERLGLPHQGVAVQHNGEIISADVFERRSLADGDRLEIVRPMGGGEEDRPSEGRIFDE